MADWTDITDASLEPNKPIRSVDGLALRDNPIALAEGAVGAPRIVNGAVTDGTLGSEKFQTGTEERDWVLGRTAGASTGVVGSYAFLAITAGGPTINTGATSAATFLRYSDSAGSEGATPAGTWRNMGDSIGPASDGTLFLRIS